MVKLPHNELKIGKHKIQGTFFPAICQFFKIRTFAVVALNSRTEVKGYIKWES
jgi:hypothetical protein